MATDQRLMWLIGGAAVVIGLLLTNWFWTSPVTDTAETLLSDTPAPKILDEHTREFDPQVIKVTDGIHLAIGFAIANSILIEAPEGAIIVDVTESYDAGREVYAAFRNITSAPIKALIYTHNHADHMYGATAFFEVGVPVPEIWAHPLLPYLVDSTTTVLPLTFSRAVRQFGTHLQRAAPAAFRNSGIGPWLRISKRDRAALVPPTHFMEGDEQDVVIAGLKLRLLHIPGETADQIGVWIPDKEAFLCADDLYRAFPNLYAIRGTPARDTMQWVRSLDKMIALNPTYLVPSHTRPLQGKQNVLGVLTSYRDAIQLVHDQTVRFMNKGLFPDDIVARVKLPKQLEEHPFLQPFYGTVEWSSRAVFDRYMGWFSGNIVELSRHTSKEKAKRMIDLAGGVQNVINTARKALNEKDARWALELATYVTVLDADDSTAMGVRLEALKALAAAQVSAPGRNYYLTTALLDHKMISVKPSAEMRKAAIMFMKPQHMFETFALRLKAEEVEGVNMRVVFNLTDIDQQYTLFLRNSILEVREGNVDDWTLKVSVEYEQWKRILTKEKNPAMLYMSGELVVDGGVSELKKFMGYFEQEEEN